MKHYQENEMPKLWLIFTIAVFAMLSGCGGSSSLSGDDDTGLTDSDTSVTGSGTGVSTSDVECTYSYSAFNSSASVNTTSTSNWFCDGSNRSLAANGIPDHDVGTFPNANNPNTISEQAVSAMYTLEPVETGTATTLGGPRGAIGYVLNGVKIDPGTAGTCNDSGGSCSLAGFVGSWSIEALGQDSFNFGDDENHAHVQPTGEYHYHGIPEGFVDNLDKGFEPTLIAWAADGFPIYARYGYLDPMDAGSGTVVIEPSYQLKDAPDANRPAVSLYEMGTFTQDYEYVEGLADLDECNGRMGVTPEFPEGIYHYYATDGFPFLQRCVKGTP
jgi:hypothetical protein